MSSSRVGVVLTVDSGNARAEVSALGSGACESCSGKGGCGINVARPPDQTQRLTAANPIGARPGDTVEFDLPGHGELTLSLLVWIVPMVALIAGAALGYVAGGRFIGDADLGAILGASAGFGGAFALLRRIDRKAADIPSMQPHILRIVHRAGEPVEAGEEACGLPMRVG